MVSRSLNGPAGERNEVSGGLTRKKEGKGCEEKKKNNLKNQPGTFKAITLGPACALLVNLIAREPIRRGGHRLAWRRRKERSWKGRTHRRKKGESANYSGHGRLLFTQTTFLGQGKEKRKGLRSRSIGTVFFDAGSHWRGTGQKGKRKRS